MIAPTQQAGYGAGPGAVPAADYKSERFGPKPPESTIELRRDVERSILGTYGLAPVLLNHQAPGTSLREAWRQFYTLSAEPVAELVGAQVSEAIGVDVTLDMRRARAADVVMLSRAVGSLVTAGLERRGRPPDGWTLMELGLWRTGGRRAWTTGEVRTLAECAAAGMGPLAIWRSGRLPGRSEGAIRAALTKHGLWARRQQAHFDGERCELSVWVFPVMKAPLKQREQRDGIALSELVRRYCAAGLQGAS